MIASDHPTLEAYLPELADFVDRLVEGISAGKIDDWAQFSERTQAFYTPARMDEIEDGIPGWGRMAAFRDGATLVHVTAAMVALRLLPEYRQALPEIQRLSEWIVLLHDIGKELHEGERDHTHGFRSAVIAGRILPAIGFPVSSEYESGFQEWAALTNSAFRPGDDGGDLTQDNRKLPEILAGIDRLFGHNSATTLAIKTILLHFSIDTCSEWPQVAPLSNEEISLYIDQGFLHYLEIMMLVDSDAWALFDPDDKAKMRAETLEVFQEVRALVKIG